MFGLKSIEKSILLFFALLFVCVLMIGMAGYDAVRKAQISLLISRGEMVASNGKEAIEYFLSVGLPVAQSLEVRKTIDDMNKNNSGLNSVTIYDVDGEGIYSSDFTQIGITGADEMVSAIAQEDHASLTQWANKQHSAAKLVYSPFGKTIGALVVELSTKQLEDVTDNSILILIMASVAAFVGGGILIIPLLMWSTKGERLWVSEQIAPLENLLEQRQFDALSTPDERTGGTDTFMGAAKAYFRETVCVDKRITELDEMA